MDNYILACNDSLVLLWQCKQGNTTKHSEMKLSMNCALILRDHQSVMSFEPLQQSCWYTTLCTISSIPTLHTHLMYIPNRQASNEVSPGNKCGVCVGACWSLYVKMQNVRFSIDILFMQSHDCSHIWNIILW